MSRQRAVAAFIGAVMLTMAAVAFGATPAETQTAGAGALPESFDVKVQALPMLAEIQAPTALPLVVTGGYGFSGVKLNSQPQLIGEASPVYAPLAGDLALLGGAGALPGIAAALLPGLLVGLGPTVGLPPVPVDPRIVPVPAVPVFPSPALPALGCLSYVPGEPNEARCGGPSQNILGFDVGAATGETRSSGSGEDPSSLASEAAVRSAGLRPTEGNSLVPVKVGGISSAAASNIVGGRVVAGAATSVTNLELAGTLDIGVVRTSLSAATAGRAGTAGLTREPCAIEGAQLFGVPVRIDGDGVHFADTDAAAKALQQPEGQNPFADASKALSGPFVDGATQGDALINEVLKAAGLTVKQLGPQGFDPGAAGIDTFFGAPPVIAADGTTIEAGNACLEVKYEIPVSGTQVRMLFGLASVTMSAFPAGGALAGQGAGGAVGDADAGVLGTGLSDAADTASGATLGLAPPPPPSPSAIAGTPSAEPIAAAGSTRLPDLGGVFAAFAILALALPVLAGLAHLNAHRRPHGGTSHAV